MSVKNYRFVSPGVFVNEIDNSQLPADPAGIGPVIIGRAESGPGLRPVTVNSFSEFVQIFGNPIPGNANGDVWRLGANVAAPTYGAYAAQAYLRNSAPLTFVRLLGNEASNSTAAGKAGWDADGAVDGEGKAWGIFVVTSSGGTATAAAGACDAVLGAVFYTSEAATSLEISGTIAKESSDGIEKATGSEITFAGAGLVAADTGVKGEYTLIINNADSNGTALKTVFNFDRTSSKYIRKVFNTTPQRVNPNLVDSELNYFLGESFDRFVFSNILTDAAQGTTFAAVVPLAHSGYDGDDFRAPLQSAQTPAVIGCDVLDRGTSANSFRVDRDAPTLFTVHALNQPGDWTNRNLKVSIQDIKISTNEADPYGTFSVVVRRLSDSDNVVQVVEQFNDCNLNPESLNYVARKIGDRSLTWNTTERRYVNAGDYDNVSKYIRVAVNEDIAGESPSLLPFGFKGITKYLNEDGADAIVASTTEGNWIASGTVGRNTFGDTLNRVANSILAESTLSFSSGSVFVISGSVSASTTAGGIPQPGVVQLTASVLYPTPEFRISASAGNLNNPTDAYFGLQTSRTAGGSVFDASTIDTLRPRGGIVGNMFDGNDATARTEESMYFTLDDLRYDAGDGAYWESGSHAAGVSMTNVSGAISGVLDGGYDRFTVPLYAGFDGLNITELDPFNSSNNNLPSTATDTNSYVFNSVRQAIDAIADPEVVEMNLASIPGLRHEGLTTNLINVCEDRADALAVVDLKGGYRPRSEGTTSARNNTASEVAQVVKNLRDRALNTSYGCAFYPWVRGRDTIQGSNVWLPPSVAAIGTFSSSQKKTQVWFAPAGFNRGGLTEGAAGIPIVDVAHQLRRKDRDTLYAANINPIAKFPAEGIVIFGQKTLQVTPSALDRINVRRLMIFVKKRVSQVASQLLFDPNVETTWKRFISLVQPILADIKTNFGLSDYKLVLDKTTTTPDLVDRNIMYAKIFLKPTRAIEYIAIDFNITRTGASFDD